MSLPAWTCPCFDPKISFGPGFLNLGKCPGFCYFSMFSGIQNAKKKKVFFKEIDKLYYNSQKIKPMTSSAVL